MRLPIKNLIPAAVAFVVAVTTASCAKPPTTTSDGAESAVSAHDWNVFDGDVLILEVHDTPGPIVSTASLPPGVPAARHAFLSASARSALHEHGLREQLNAAKSLPDFLSRLRGSGYKVVPLSPHDVQGPR